MKTNDTCKRLARWLAAGLIGGALTTTILTAAPERPDPKQLLEEAQNLERKAQELKAGDHHEEAGKLMREVMELRAKAERMETSPGPGPADQDRHRQELKREINDLLVKIKELRSAGKDDAAAEVKQRIVELEKQLHTGPPPPELRRDKKRLPGQPGEFAPGRGPDRPERPLRPRREGPDQRPRLRGGPPGDRPGPPPQEMAEAHRRLHHLQAAVDNLRAIGMNEPADRLAQQAEDIRRHLQSGPQPMSPGREGRGPGAEGRRGPVPGSGQRAEAGRGPGPSAQRGQGPGQRAEGGRGPGPGAAGGPGPIAEFRRMRAELQELRQAVQELRRRIEEPGRDRR